MTTGRVLSFLLFLVAAVIVVASLFLRQPVSYGLVAETERLEFVVADDALLPIHLRDAQVIFLDSDGAVWCAKSMNGVFEPGAGVRANFRRVGYGRVELNFKASEDANPSAGILERFDDGGDAVQTEELSDLGCEKPFSNGELTSDIAEVAIFFDDARQRLRNGVPVRIPIEVKPVKTGAVEFGAADGVVDPDGPPMLFNAKITMISRTIVGEQVFVGGTSDLGLGDRVEFRNPRATGVGFALAGDKPGLTVTYRTVAEAAWVTRFRSDGYAVTISRYQRFLNDPMIKGVWGAILTLIGLAGKLGIDALKSRRANVGNRNSKT